MAQLGLKYAFLFALENERTQVTCKSCEARFPNANKKVCFTPYIYAKATSNPYKVEKINVIFPSRDQWHSLENVCHSFL